MYKLAQECIFSNILFLNENTSPLSLKSICVIVQAKAEDVDLHNPAYMSDNLIDFTDSTPVVSFCRPHLEFGGIACGPPQARDKALPLKSYYVEV